MNQTRRNTLLSIGVLAAGAGVIGASGAFTSVTAHRKISVASTGDSTANIQIVVNEVEGLVDSGTETIGLSFQNLNQNAVMTYNGAITVTPQGSNRLYDIAVNETLDPVILNVNNGTSVTGGTSVAVDIEIDLTGTANISDIPVGGTIEISVTQSNWTGADE